MKPTYWLMALLIALSQTACNTTQGVGEDVQETGEAVEDLGESAEEELED